MRCLRRWGRAAAPIVCLIAATAHAHGVRTDIRLTLDASGIEGVHVELHQGDIAPQLVLENRSGKMLEILDGSGAPFLRIGPRDVRADVRSPLWRASLNPASTPGTVAANPGAANWKTVRAEPAYGWFDPRINPDPVQIPAEVRALAREAPVSAWRIPARLGGQPFELIGQFIYLPPPRGVVQAMMRSSMDLAPGVRVMLAPGKIPALFLDNRSKEVLSVLDAQGRAFLRIGPDGVHADTGSAAWRAAAPIRTASTGWRRISKARSYTWLEPRAAWQGALPRSGERQTLNRWQVPMRVGKRPLEISGVNEWIPLPAPAIVPREEPWR